MRREALASRRQAFKRATLQAFKRATLRFSTRDFEARHFTAAALDVAAVQFVLARPRRWIGDPCQRVVEQGMLDLRHRLAAVDSREANAQPLPTDVAAKS